MIWKQTGQAHNGLSLILKLGVGDWGEHEKRLLISSKKVLANFFGALDVESSASFGT